MVYRKLSSKMIYQGKVFNVRCDQVELPNGQRIGLDIVEHRGAVTLVPIDEQEHIWFVRQYRHPVEQILLELPAGIMEESELPEDCALREVREEIGMAAGRIQKLGEFFLAPGYSSEYMYVFLARDLTPDPLVRDEDEFIEVEQIPLEQVLQMVRVGQIRDAKTLAALFLLNSLAH